MFLKKKTIEDPAAVTNQVKSVAPKASRIGLKLSSSSNLIFFNYYTLALNILIVKQFNTFLFISVYLYSNFWCLHLAIGKLSINYLLI